MMHRGIGSGIGIERQTQSGNDKCGNNENECEKNTRLETSLTNSFIRLHLNTLHTQLISSAKPYFCFELFHRAAISVVIPQGNKQFGLSVCKCVWGRKRGCGCEAEKRGGGGYCYERVNLFYEELFKLLKKRPHTACACSCACCCCCFLLCLLLSANLAIWESAFFHIIVILWYSISSSGHI